MQDISSRLYGATPPFPHPEQLPFTDSYLDGGEPSSASDVSPLPDGMPPLPSPWVRTFAQLIPDELEAISPLDGRHQEKSEPLLVNHAHRAETPLKPCLKRPRRRSSFKTSPFHRSLVHDGDLKTPIKPHIILAKKITLSLRKIFTPFLGTPSAHFYEETIGICADVDRTLDAVEALLSRQKEMELEHEDAMSSSWKAKHARRILSLQKTIPTLHQFMKHLDKNLAGLELLGVVNTSLILYAFKVDDLVVKMNSSFDRLEEYSRKKNSAHEKSVHWNEGSPISQIHVFSKFEANATLDQPRYYPYSPISPITPFTPRSPFVM